jgi:hypothetical protein
VDVNIHSPIRLHDVVLSYVQGQLMCTFTVTELFSAMGWASRVWCKVASIANKRTSRWEGPAPCLIAPLQGAVQPLLLSVCCA